MAGRGVQHMHPCMARWPAMLLALLCMPAALQPAWAAAPARNGEAGGAALSCNELGQHLDATGLWLLKHLTDGGQQHCNASVAGPHALGLTQQGEAAALAWRLQLQLSHEALHQELHRRKASQGGVWRRGQHDPLVAGLMVTSQLCMPRVALLLAWARHAVWPHLEWLQHWREWLLPGGQRDAPAATASVPDDEKCTPDQQQQQQQQRQLQQASEQLAALQLMQHLLTVPDPGMQGPRPSLMAAAQAAGLGQNEYQVPPLRGWSSWLAWALCPGLLMAKRSIITSSDHPFFVLYVCTIGLLRTGLEGYGFCMALCRSRAENLESWFISHIAPGLFSTLLAALQVLTAPLTPLSLAQALFWLCILLLPPMDICCLVVAWLPVEDVWQDDERVVVVRRRSGRRHRAQHAGRLQWQDGAVLGAAAAAVGAMGGAVRSGEGGSGSSGLHWPPPLEVAPEIEELPMSEVPEAFRCPITLCLMREPAQSTSGITFERFAIMQWLSTHRHDPITQAAARKRHLSPNHNLRQLMETWMGTKLAELNGTSAVPTVQNEE